LRAERRLGELLAALPKQDGGDAARARSQAATEVPTRPDELGISKSQSSRCQAIAAVPEPVFEEYVPGVREQGRADGKTELTTTGALLVARQYRPSSSPTPLLTPPAEQSDPRHHFDVADAAALPWPDSSVDLVVTSPPCGLDINYLDGDDSDYAGWLARLDTWLAQLYRVARHASGRLCLNVPLDRDRGGWQPVSADAINIAGAVGWQFRTWLLWDKLQAGAGTDRGSIDSAGAPNVTAPVESVLVFFRGSGYRTRPAAMPHQAWLDLCGPRGASRARMIQLPQRRSAKCCPSDA